MLQHVTAHFWNSPGLDPSTRSCTGRWNPHRNQPILSVAPIRPGLSLDESLLRGLYSAGFIPASFNEAPDEMMHRGLKLRVHEACWFPPNSDFFSVDFHKTSHLFTSDILQVTRYVHCYFHWCKQTQILHCWCRPRKNLMRPPYVSICQHLACVSMKSKNRHGPTAQQDKSRSTQSRQRISTKKDQRIQNSPSLSMRLPPTLEIRTPNELRRVSPRLSSSAWDHRCPHLVNLCLPEGNCHAYTAAPNDEQPPMTTPIVTGSIIPSVA